MSDIVVVEELLLDAGLVVFRGRNKHGNKARYVGSSKLVPRAPSPGETWQIDGKWHQHDKYGYQVEIESASLLRPTGSLIIDALAHSPEFPGIGPVRARALWEKFGEELLELLDHLDPAPFIALLGDDLARVLVQGWLKIDIDTKAYKWLMRHGFPVGLSKKLTAIYRQVPVPPEYADEAAAVSSTVWHLERDPYRMLAFTSWSITEAAARRMGVTEMDARRLVGAVEYALSRQLAEGHTWVSAADLVKQVVDVGSFSRRDARHAIGLAVQRSAVIALDGGYQAHGAHFMERFVATRIHQMIDGQYAAEQTRLAPSVTGAALADTLTAYQQAEGYTLNDEQRKAIWLAVTEQFNVLLGGPGVGKTTVLKAVLAAAERFEIRVFQAALSGRAAMRMSEATGQPARTITSLLWRIDLGDISLDDDCMVILDEASMVDLATMYRLLRRMPPGARLMLVGDPGQLPPIGYGLTLHTCADSSSIPKVRLTQVHRQTAASGIPSVCSAIRDGRVPALPAFSSGTTSGVAFMEVPGNEITDTVIDLLGELPGGDRQVVGSVKWREGGVKEINARLHTLHSVGRDALGTSGLFLGEPVLATANDYSLDVMNGELGTVIGIEEQSLRCRFGNEVKLLPPEYVFASLELGFAITCHKAQGSQFRRVIIPIVKSRILDRSLLLTAVSRAQEQVVLVGDRSAFEAAVIAPPSSQRNVGLSSILETLVHGT